jgi:hypothetical protein
MAAKYIGLWFGNDDYETLAEAWSVLPDAVAVVEVCPDGSIARITELLADPEATA